MGNKSEIAKSGANHFLAGGGIMGAAIRSKDWSATPLGPVESWPQSLRTTVSLCLASNFPINVIWGPEHTQIYNDGYRPICGAKHPRALGENYTISWASAWPILNDAFWRALAGRTSFLENERMFLDRNGYLEETFFTFSLSPIRDETGGIGGLFHPVTETTAQMLNQRRTSALQRVTSRAGHAKNVEEAAFLLMEALAGYPLDLPFALLYLLNDEPREARLIANANLQSGMAASPTLVDLREPSARGWPFHAVLNSGSAQVVEDLETKFGSLACGPYPESPKTALILPIAIGKASKPTAIFLAGVSPRLKLDDSYRAFYDLLAAGVSAVMANAHAYEAERKRAEGLAELDRAKTTFFSNISHEFRTPLTLMLGPLQEMLSQDTTVVTADHEEVDSMYRNTLRLLRLVNTLLDFSRIEVGRIQACYEPLDVAELTKDLTSTFRSIIERAGLTFVVDCPPVSEPVFVDREMWEKVVLNLLSNAFKYTFNGQITVTLRECEGNIELSVSDTGTGIASEELPEIFKRFHRVAGARGRTYEGTGIGLALVDDLVKLHSGSVRVESEPGVGTTFTVCIRLGSAHLPMEQLGLSAKVNSSPLTSKAFTDEASQWLRASESGIAIPGEHLNLSGTDNVRPCILLADDNADMRQYIRKILAPAFDVKAVNNGALALASLQRRTFDLVLTDVMMPELDGFGLVRELRKDPRTQSIPVIMLSARAGEEAHLEGLRAGADDYLTKPFSARELVARVSSSMELARLRHKLAREEEGRRSTEELKAQWRLFNTALSNTPDFTYLFDLEGRFTYVNEALLALFDRPRHEVLGKKFFDLAYSPDLVNKLDGQIQSVVATRQPVRDEIPFTAPSGNIRHFEYIFVPVLANDGTVEAVAGSTRDVTERRKVEQELRSANAELEEFAHVASHDMQEPLRMVNIYTQLLLKHFADATDKDIQGYAAFIREGVQHMTNLIRDLLSYSRTIHEEYERFPSADLVVPFSQALTVLRSRIAESGANISRDYLPKVLGNEAQLEQVFINLLANALKYVKPGMPACVHVSAARNGKEWIISVRDNGIGFDPQYAERIFGLFKRLHKNAYPGTGLGLAICKRIIERHGGRIWAESEIEKGSVFSFSLPSAAADETAEPK